MSRLQDPPGLALYTITGYLPKENVKIPILIVLVDQHPWNHFTHT